MSFRSPKCRALYEHWHALPKPAGAIVPLKSAFDPMAIPRLLPRMLLHDLRQPDRSIMRLVGTGLVAQFGFDPTGQDYIRYVAPWRRQSALAELVKVAAQPCGMRVVIEHVHGSGKSVVSESTGFPLDAEDGGGRFLLFLDDPLGEPTFEDPRDEPLEILNVLERVYIDIGAGVPPAGEAGRTPSA